MKIVVLDGYTENPGDLSWDALSRLGELTVYDRTAPEDTFERVNGAQIVLTNKTVLNAQLIDAASSLRYIGVLATGYNVVDVCRAKQKGIIVTNVPTYGTTAVAQHVFAMLLEICHHVAHHNDAVQQGRWTSCQDFCFWDYPLIELSGKTMGIIGFGRIGRAVAKIAEAFGMRVLAYDPCQTGPEMRKLDEVLRLSDVISLHCPLLDSTQRIINEEALSKMKPTAILINTSRGALIDDEALCMALKTHRIQAALLDVISTEPIPANHPLLGLENCLITPHIAWAPKESRQRLMDVAVSNVQAFLAGKPINQIKQ